MGIQWHPPLGARLLPGAHEQDLACLSQLVTRSGRSGGADASEGVRSCLGVGLHTRLGARAKRVRTMHRARVHAAVLPSPPHLAAESRCQCARWTCARCAYSQKAAPGIVLLSRCVSASRLGARDRHSRCARADALVHRASSERGLTYGHTCRLGPPMPFDGCSAAHLPCSGVTDALA